MPVGVAHSEYSQVASTEVLVTVSLDSTSRHVRTASPPQQNCNCWWGIHLQLTSAGAPPPLTSPFPAHLDWNPNMVPDLFCSEPPFSHIRMIWRPATRNTRWSVLHTDAPTMKCVP